MNPLAEVLPEVAALLEDLDAAVASGQIDTTEAFIAECRRRWDAPAVSRVDAVVPGWEKMSSYADGKTLWHINVAMVALSRLDEYRSASDHVRHLLEWTVLLHDIAKEPTHELRDHRHAFRSAAVAARTLPRLGFATTPAFHAEYDDWRAMVHTAWRHDSAAGEDVNDNTYLPGIISGIRRMFEPDAADLLTAIALHLSVTVVADWPSIAPLTANEEDEYITPSVARLQLPLMLADSGGWEMFDPESLHAMYVETRSVFARIAAQRAS